MEFGWLGDVGLIFVGMAALAAIFALAIRQGRSRQDTD
jgi:hypothetical protein